MRESRVVIEAIDDDELLIRAFASDIALIAFSELEHAVWGVATWQR